MPFAERLREGQSISLWDSLPPSSPPHLLGPKKAAPSAIHLPSLMGQKGPEWSRARPTQVPQSAGPGGNPAPLSGHRGWGRNRNLSQGPVPPQTTAKPLRAPVSRWDTHSSFLSLGRPSRMAATCWAPASPIRLWLKLRERTARKVKPPACPPSPPVYFPLPEKKRSQSLERDLCSHCKRPLSLCWVRTPNSCLLFRMFSLVSDLNPSCCNPYSCILSLGLPCSRGHTAWTWVKEMRLGSEGCAPGASCFCHLPRPKLSCLWGGTGNSPQFLQAGGSSESLRKVVAADITKVIPA